MEFGKVSAQELGAIDFKLPHDDPRTWVQLRKHHRPPDREPRFHIGTPIWAAKSWVGTIYPLGTQAKDYLHHYSRQFTSIELNTTHYRVPDRETIERWKESAPDGFRFCPKWPQDISHRSPLWSHAELTSQFTSAILDLGHRLGLTFLQLPPTFTVGELPDLERFLRALPKGFPIAVEFRHHSFFFEHALVDRAFEVLDKNGASTVITDVAGRRDVLHTTVVNDAVMIRLIGNDFHPTDDVRIKEWIDRLETWVHLGLSEIYFFLHQGDDAHMPEFVARFIDQLNRRLHLSVPKWQPANQGEQLGLFPD